MAWEPFQLQRLTVSFRQSRCSFFMSNKVSSCWPVAGLQDRQYNTYTVKQQLWNLKLNWRRYTFPLLAGFTVMQTVMSRGSKISWSNCINQSIWQLCWDQIWRNGGIEPAPSFPLAGAAEWTSDGRMEGWPKSKGESKGGRNGIWAALAAGTAQMQWLTESDRGANLIYFPGFDWVRTPISTLNFASFK